MKRLVSAFSVAALLLGVMASPAAASVSLVATISGGGTSEMQDPLPAGSSVFSMNIRLYSDGTASGHIDCVDQWGDWEGFPGNIWGEVTSWSGDLHGAITLTLSGGGFVPIPGGPGFPVDVPFTVTIQHFGGAGVGHWTLAVPDGSGGLFTVCYELLTSGQIVIRYV
jgi:hypothetical protein